MAKGFFSYDYQNRREAYVGWSFVFKQSAVYIIVCVNVHNYVWISCRIQSGLLVIFKFAANLRFLSVFELDLIFASSGIVLYVLTLQFPLTLNVYMQWCPLNTATFVSWHVWLLPPQPHPPTPIWCKLLFDLSQFWYTSSFLALNIFSFFSLFFFSIQLDVSQPNIWAAVFRPTHPSPPNLFCFELFPSAVPLC